MLLRRRLFGTYAQRAKAEGMVAENCVLRRPGKPTLRYTKHRLLEPGSSANAPVVVVRGLGMTKEDSLTLASSLVLDACTVVTMDARGVDGGSARNGDGTVVFQDLADKISSAEEDWHTWYDLEAPETEPLPGGKEMAEMGHVEKMVILRALRADRVTFALKHFINESMGSSFVTQPPFDMKGTYQEASASTPIFFVLFPGVDPTPWDRIDQLCWCAAGSQPSWCGRHGPSG